MLNKTTYARLFRVGFPPVAAGIAGIAVALSWGCLSRPATEPDASLAPREATQHAGPPTRDLGAPTRVALAPEAISPGAPSHGATPHGVTPNGVAPSGVTPTGRSLPVAAAAGAASTAPASPQAASPVPVGVFSGTPEEMGQAYARRFGNEVNTLLDGYLRPFFATEVQRIAVLGMASLFDQHLSDPHRAELNAMADALKIDRRELLLAQCFLDLTPMTACSTIALSTQASPDGIARMGRNLDFPALDIADRYSVVLAFEPADGRYGFTAVSWPGMIGVLSGMNEHGLVLCNMEVRRTGSLPRAMPYTLLYRTVLERCRTVDEAIALLEKTPRQTPNNLMLMDASGDRAAVELTVEGVAVRRAADNEPLISTNHQRGPDGGTAGRCWRYDALRSAGTSQWGRIERDAVETMLETVQQGEMTMQAMVFEPRSRTLWLATGKRAAEQQFYRVVVKQASERRDSAAPASGAPTSSAPASTPPPATAPAPAAAP